MGSGGRPSHGVKLTPGAGPLFYGQGFHRGFCSGNAGHQLSIVRTRRIGLSLEFRKTRLQLRIVLGLRAKLRLQPGDPRQQFR